MENTGEGNSADFSSLKKCTQKHSGELTSPGIPESGKK